MTFSLMLRESIGNLTARAWHVHCSCREAPYTPLFLFRDTRYDASCITKYGPSELVFDPSADIHRIMVWVRAEYMRAIGRSI